VNSNSPNTYLLPTIVRQVSILDVDRSCYAFAFNSIFISAIESVGAVVIRRPKK